MTLNPRLVLVPLLLIGVAGCGAKQIRNNQGYIADEELVASVQPGVDTRESVEKALGRPTMAGQWEGDAWYYVSRTTKQLAFAYPKPRDQTILIVRFAADGTVSAVEKRGMDKVVALSPIGDKTPTLGRDHSLWDDLFGNIGTVGTLPGGGGGGAP